MISSSTCAPSIIHPSPINYLCTMYALSITYHLPVYYLSLIHYLSSSTWVPSILYPSPVLSVTYPLFSGANIGMCVYISPHTLISYLCFLENLDSGTPVAMHAHIAQNQHLVLFPPQEATTLWKIGWF